MLARRMEKDRSEETQNDQARWPFCVCERFRSTSSLDENNIHPRTTLHYRVDKHNHDDICDDNPWTRSNEMLHSVSRLYGVLEREHSTLSCANHSLTLKIQARMDRFSSLNVSTISWGRCWEYMCTFYIIAKLAPIAKHIALDIIYIGTHHFKVGDQAIECITKSVQIFITNRTTVRPHRPGQYKTSRMRRHWIGCGILSHSDHFRTLLSCLL